MAVNAKREWFRSGKSTSEVHFRLFCLPYAGGGASAYHKWAKAFPGGVEVCAAQIPGRENRFRQEPYREMAALVSAMADAIVDLIDIPYAFFGHSMGALLSFEVSREIRRRGLPQPEYIGVSGRGAPHVSAMSLSASNLSDKELLEAIRDLDGTPSQVFDSPELLELILPTLRADMLMCEGYRFCPGEPLSCRIAVFGGKEDESVELGGLAAWRDLTRASCSLRILPGGHFFLHTSQKQLIGMILEDLRDIWQSRWDGES